MSGKDKKVTVNVRLKPDEHAKLKQAAARVRRSLTGYVLNAALEQAERDERADGAGSGSAPAAGA